MHLGKKRRSRRTRPLIKLNSNPDWGHFHVNVIILGDSTYHMIKTRKIIDKWMWPKKKNHVRIVCEVKISNSKAYEVYSHVLSHPSSIYVISSWKSSAMITSSMCRTRTLVLDGTETGIKKGSISDILADKNREFWLKVRYLLRI